MPPPKEVLRAKNRIRGRGRPAISRSALANAGACHRPGQHGKLRKAVTVAGILQHERAFQRIANNNDGTRASGTPGYDASADYVVKKLRTMAADRQQSSRSPNNWRP
jgi:hypothetical protein